MQPNNIIKTLQKEFLKEATSAPKLFRDLGKVEQYIAESYKMRSFIELIQNADDASSSAFGIFNSDNMLVVANNGRPFTEHDIEALCRSGSSNKYRGGNTIGYRGIGFKSVLNLARRIYIFSGGFKFFFDKEITRQLLPGIPEVPLIRVPHLYEQQKIPLRVSKQLIEMAEKNGYTTRFIFFDIDHRIVDQELQEFDRNSLLFLNNIRQVICRSEGIKREISITKQHRNNRQFIEIQEGDQTDTWELLTSSKNIKDMIALKIKDDSIIPATRDESVVHSFTPTIEFAGAFIKINGDFSTDPSRKNIDFDDISELSLANVLKLLVDTIVDVMEGKRVRKGFFSPFVNVPNLEGNKFKAKLYIGIIEGLNSKKLKINGKQVAFSSLRLRPEWLNYEDYEKICAVHFCPINKQILTIYPELHIFLELVGVKQIYIHEVIDSINKAELSVTGAAQITAKIISQYRFDMTKDKVAEISTLKLFPKGKYFVTSKEVKSADELKKDFVTYLANHVEASDLKQFIMKTGIKPGKLLQETIMLSAVSQAFLPAEALIQPLASAEKSYFKSMPDLKKWRSAEKNALEYLNALNGVLSVGDVTAANMGYDLEVMLESGIRIYIEVKSVSSFNEPFKITNNEYSSAHNFGDKYYLALVINDEPFQMKLVPDPINNLSFQKQVERWSWLCENYSHNLQDVIRILN